MTFAVPDVDRLRQERPEWEPWLALVRETLADAAGSRWDDSVPEPKAHADVALLTGAAVSLPGGSIRHLMQRLLRHTSKRRTPELATLEALLDANVNVIELFAASVEHELDRVGGMADRYGVDAEALHAVAALLPVPFLQACCRRWSARVSANWLRGYCPVCASWPSFAEVRGIERTRYLRCGRCGAAWHANPLSCAFCGTSDHEDLVALVPEAGTQALIEACTRCSGYLKVFTRLQGCAPGAVMIEDLASVALDIAALEHGYRRPGSTGRPIEVAVTEAQPTRRFLAWRV